MRYIMTAETTITIIMGLATIVSAFCGILVANKLSTYRIEQLEKKVEKHNCLLERVTRVEMRLDGIDVQHEHELKQTEEKHGSL